MHPENGPRRTLRAFPKASHTRKECGQDIAPACEPPHATATVVLARCPSKSRRPATLNFHERGHFLPEHRPRVKFERRIRHSSGFNEKAIRRCCHIWEERYYHPHQSHRPFALLTSISHTFQYFTHVHDTLARSLSDTLARRGVKMSAASNTFFRGCPWEWSRHLTRDQVPLAITTFHSIPRGNTWMSTTRSSYWQRDRRRRYPFRSNGNTVVPQVHPLRKAVESPVVDAASPAVAEPPPCLPREDAVLIAGDDDRDVMGPRGIPVLLYRRGGTVRATPDGRAWPRLRVVLHADPRKPVNAPLLVSYLSSVTRSRDVLLHFPMNLPRDDVRYRRRDPAHTFARAIPPSASPPFLHRSTHRGKSYGLNSR